MTAQTLHVMVLNFVNILNASLNAGIIIRMSPTAWALCLDKASMELLLYYREIILSDTA